VKDTSLRMPHGEWGKVVNVKVFSSQSGDDLPAGINQWVQVWVAQKRKISVGDKLAGRHGNKGVVSIIAPVEDMPFLPDGRPVDMILNPIGVPSRMNIGQVLETHLGWAAYHLGAKVLSPVFDGADDTAIEDALARAWLVQKAGLLSLVSDAHAVPNLAEVKAWLTSRGYDGEPVFDDRHPGRAREVCLRLWLEDLGIASQNLSPEELEQAVDQAAGGENPPPPILGKVVLRDGHTGEAFDQPVTIGCIYMMKLNHLVEDKVHARSTGPYSLISQQPLGGKAQFGGQRFGEMEVWALEAYGAAHNLQEILTIKSDDVVGRAKTYEAIVKNEDIIQSGVPESFKVLIMELRSLGLAIEVISEEEKLALPETESMPAEELTGPTEPEAELTPAEELAEPAEPEAELAPAEKTTEPAEPEAELTPVEETGQPPESEAEPKPTEAESQIEVTEDNA
jgi:DNA-directed RNA polymerase subunit beta